MEREMCLSLESLSLSLWEKKGKEKILVINELNRFWVNHLNWLQVQTEPPKKAKSLSDPSKKKRKQKQFENKNALGRENENTQLIQNTRRISK